MSTLKSNKTVNSKKYITGSFAVPLYSNGIGSPATGFTTEPRVYNPEEIQPGAKVVTVPYTQSGWRWDKEPVVNRNNERVKEAFDKNGRRLTITRYGDTHKVYLFDKNGNQVEIDPDRVYNNLVETYPEEMLFKEGGLLKNNNNMTYDYNEFINQFAGVEEYKCGGKTKIESASCGCKSKKVKKAEAGMKNKKQDPDANDNAAVKPGDKIDNSLKWAMEQLNKLQSENQNSKDSNIFDRFRKTTTAASGIVNASKKLVKRK